jgi:phosphate starvation-inducible protein PhoH
MPKQVKREPKQEVNPYLTKLDYAPDAEQRKYLKAIDNSQVVFVDAPSGSGKTTLAVERAFNALRTGKADRIVYIRLVDDRYLQNGYLSGNLEEKTQKLFVPFFDALKELKVSKQAFEMLIRAEKVSLETDTALRGTNMKGTFLIIDEAQNAKDIDTLRLILTRLHDDGGTAVVIGHSGQQDNKKVQTVAGKTPFQIYAYHMAKKTFTSVCKLTKNYRGEISQWADNIEESIQELIKVAEKR